MIARAACLALLLATAPASAQSMLDPNEATVNRVNAGTVGVVSGGVDGTYIRIAADLSAVLDDGDQLRVLALVGKGSIGNISDIMYLRGIDIGIVQSDVLAYAQRQRLYPGIERTLQFITKLYDEELHILARKDITSLQDLAGQPVNVDGRTSGTAMTASIIFDALGIPIRPVNDDQAAAFEKLQRGELAAIVYVAGKPARLFAGADSTSGLHFLPVPITPALLETYLPSNITHADYPALVPEGGDVETVAVGSVMAVYAWPTNSDRYRKVARFVTAFFDKFPALQNPPRHPKWREVNLAAQVPGWARFPAAQDWLRAQTTRTSDQRSDFPTFLSQSGAPGTLTDTQRAALFEQFLAWQKRRQPAP